MATATAMHIPETINLQLRKPKHWNWELSTSKSSPTIIMPIIKLYDYKGNLLVEAKDNGTTTTSIYGSDLKLNDDHGSTRSAKRRRNLIRSRSDTSGPLASLMKKASSGVSINSQDRKHLTQRSNNSVNSEGFKESSDRNDPKTSNAVENSIFQENEHGQKKNKAEGTARNRLEKSKSELLYEKRGNVSLSKNVERSQTTAEVGEKNRHRRSKSDDLFRRKLRYNSKESIKRAEMDGYRNFITPNIPNEETQTNEVNKSDKNKKSNKNRVMHTVEAVSVDDNSKNLELSEFLQNRKYTTRTSSAGTLIIPKESFKEVEDCRRRRRRRRDGNTGSWPLESVMEGKDSNPSGDCAYNIRPFMMTPLLNPITGAKQLCNESQIRTRGVIEKVFGVWKRRFPVLAYGCRLKLETTLTVIVATAVLQNIAQQIREGEPPVVQDYEQLNNLIAEGYVPNILVGQL